MNDIERQEELKKYTFRIRRLFKGNMDRIINGQVLYYAVCGLGDDINAIETLINNNRRFMSDVLFKHLHRLLAVTKLLMKKVG